MKYKAVLPAKYFNWYIIPSAVVLRINYYGPGPRQNKFKMIVYRNIWSNTRGGNLINVHLAIHQ